MDYNINKLEKIGITSKMAELEKEGLTERAGAIQVQAGSRKKAAAESEKETAFDGQLSLFDIYPEDHPVLKQIREMDISNMTPIQALMKLDELQKKLRS